MSSNMFFILIVLIIFGLAGVKFLVQGIKMSTQNNQVNTKIKNVTKNTKAVLNFVVGGWFVIFVIIVAYLAITRLP